MDKAKDKQKIQKSAEALIIGTSSTNYLKFIIWFFLLLLLIGLLLFYVLKMFPQIEQTKIRNHIEQFKSNLVQAHTQWLWQGRPEQLIIKQQKFSKNTTKLLMNKKGWPITNADNKLNNSCEQLWTILQDNHDLAVTSKAIIINDKQAIIGQFSYFQSGICQYFLDEKAIFYYDLDQGIIQLGEYEKTPTQ